MLTRSLAVDYGPAGVRANCVCPGWVRTTMGDEDMARVASLHGTDVEGAYRLAHEGHPPARPAEPEEIAAVVAFLASAEASYVTALRCLSTAERPQSTPRRPLFAKPLRKFRPTRSV
jgi:meso-butanediol dehydrogenase / (S,S)-butanediol dehydrogenase / diacetyl reductase